MKRTWSDSETDAAIRANVRKIMIWRGLSYAQLSTGAGLPHNTLLARFGKQTRGVAPTPFTAAEVVHIARLFRVPVAVLLGGQL